MTNHLKSHSALRHVTKMMWKKCRTVSVPLWPFTVLRLPVGCSCLSTCPTASCILAWTKQPHWDVGVGPLPRELWCRSLALRRQADHRIMGKRYVTLVGFQRLNKFADVLHDVLVGLLTLFYRCPLSFVSLNQCSYQTRVDTYCRTFDHSKVQHYLLSTQMKKPYFDFPQFVCVALMTQDDRSSSLV